MVPKIVNAVFGIPDERGIRLWAEVIVYLKQRCLCSKCKNHVDEERAIRMVVNWPGSLLSDLEIRYVHYLVGKSILVPMTAIDHICPMDLTMGSEHCIQQLTQKASQLFEIMKVKHQELYN